MIFMVFIIFIYEVSAGPRKTRRESVNLYDKKLHVHTSL
jgi:hypothetical protein